MAHRVAIALSILLGLVSWIFGFAVEEVLVCLVHIHIGIGKTLRVGFLQPLPFFLERLQLRLEGHLGFFVDI